MRRVGLLFLMLFLLTSPAWAGTRAPTTGQKLLGISPEEQVQKTAIVRFRSTKAMERLAAKMSDSVRKRYRRFAMMSVDLSGKTALKLAGRKDVLYIERNISFHLHKGRLKRRVTEGLRKSRTYDFPYGLNYEGVTPTQEYQYGLANMGITEAFHETGKLGKGVKVGIIDTGVDTDHPDLFVTGGWNVSHTWPHSELYYDDVLGHGTHVAGIIAAKRNGFGVIGVAPEAEIYSLPIFDMFGNTTLDRILDAVQWAIDHELDILNMSFGGSIRSAALEDVLEKAYESGILLLASAGNDGRTSVVSYPARYDCVVAVSALDENNEIADFSSRGPSVEVAAPGVDILSTFTYPPFYEHVYDYLSGTSMACPHVVGMAALIMSANPGISHEEVRDRLAMFAKDLGPEGRDRNYGSGIPRPDRDPLLPDQYSPMVVVGGPYRGLVRQPVRFSPAGTLDGDDNFLNYEWDFGDGSTAEGRYPEHTYGEPGNYTVTLTVRDQNGLSDLGTTIASIRAGIEKTVRLQAASMGFVRAPNYVYLDGGKVVAGSTSNRHLYGVMLFLSPELSASEDVFVLSADLELTGSMRTKPDEEGIITAGLLPPEVSTHWSRLSYSAIDQADVTSLSPSIFLSHLQDRVDNGLLNRFGLPGNRVGSLEEQFKSGRMAFRMELQTSESGNYAAWVNPELVVRYLERVSETNMPPVADAGYDRRVRTGSRVVLEGSASYDPDGTENSLTHLWRQIDGKQVPLEGTNTPIAVFDAPHGDDLLTFELEVSDGIFETVDEVNIYPNDAPADLHQLVLTPRFGKAGYVESDQPEHSFFDKAMIIAGARGRPEGEVAVSVGAVQFDLNAIPPGSQIAAAALELTGAGYYPVPSHLNWYFRILEPGIDEKWPELDYNTLTNAGVLATLSPVLRSNDMDYDVVNHFDLNPALLEDRRSSSNKVTFRIEGPTSIWGTAWEWFAWWSGNRSDTGHLAPRLIIEYGALEPSESPAPPPPTPGNHSPVTDIPLGPDVGDAGKEYAFVFSAFDQDGDALILEIDWGDGSSVEQYDLEAGGGTIELGHIWEQSGAYAIRARAIDEKNASSAWNQASIQVQSPGAVELTISDSPTGTWYLGSSYGRRLQAQSFKAIGSTVEAGSIALTSIGEPIASVQVSIRRSLYGAPLASTEILPSQVTSTDPDVPAWVNVTFSVPAAVNEGSYYYLALEAGQVDASNYYRVGYDRTNPYRWGMWYLNREARRDLDMACSVTFTP